MLRQLALLMLTLIGLCGSFTASWYATVAVARARLSVLTWRSAEEAWARAGNHWEEARAASEATVTVQNAERDELIAAIAAAEDAAFFYRVSAGILMAAVAYDVAAHPRPAGKGSISSCELTSTRSHRRALTRSGVGLEGKDIDHIVPRALGGADHPLNYQVLPSSVNRGLGASWGIGKCWGAGLPQCAAAVAVSARCGSFVPRVM